MVFQNDFPQVVSSPIGYNNQLQVVQQYWINVASMQTWEES